MKLTQKRKSTLNLSKLGLNLAHSRKFRNPVKSVSLCDRVHPNTVSECERHVADFLDENFGFIAECDRRRSGCYDLPDGLTRHNWISPYDEPLVVGELVFAVNSCERRNAVAELLVTKAALVFRNLKRNIRHDEAQNR